MNRRQYTREFKEQAVQLTYTSGKPVSAIASDLGINSNMLHRWRREEQASRGGVIAFPGHGQTRDEELMQLRKALKQAELERDILKKAIAFLAQPPQ